MPTRYYSNTASATSLSAAIDATQTTITVGATTGHPTFFPYVLVIDKTVGGKAEAVDVLAASGTTLTVRRGVDGTAGTSHTAGAVVTHDHTARDYAEVQDRLDVLETGRSFVHAFLFGGS